MRPRDSQRRDTSPCTPNRRGRKSDLEDEPRDAEYKGHKGKGLSFWGKDPRRDKSTSRRWNDVDGPEGNSPMSYGSNTNERGRESHQRFHKGRHASRGGTDSMIRSESDRGLDNTFHARKVNDFTYTNRGRSQSMKGGRDTEDASRRDNNFTYTNHGSSLYSR
jgi:hypothetical protein